MSNSWPPSAERVARAAPVVLAALAAPIVALTLASLKDDLTAEEKLAQAKEIVRRKQHVTEIVEKLIASEKVNEDARTPKNGDPEKDTSPTAKDSSPIADGSPTDGDGEDEDDELDQIKFEVIHQKCSELADIERRAGELRAGVEWCGKCLLKELRVGVKKTEQGKDDAWSDGEKLQGLMHDVEQLDALARDAKHPVPKDIRTEITTVWKNADRVRRAQKRLYAQKAAKLLLLATEAWPWMIANNLQSALAASVGTLSLHYRAELLQSLQSNTKGSSQLNFRRCARAVVIIEVAAALAKALESQIRNKTRAVLAKSLQGKLYRSLFDKDLTWWSTQKESRRGGLLMTVWFLPEQVDAALRVPAQIIKHTMSIAVQAALVRQKSSRMLYMLMGIHWAQMFTRKALDWLKAFLSKKATAGLVMPAQDQFTWLHALTPEFIGMYQSFVRGEHEVQELQKYSKVANRIHQREDSVEHAFSPIMASVMQAGSIAQYSTMGNFVKDGIIDVTSGETLMHYSQEVGGECEGVYRDISRAQGIFRPLAQAYDYISIAPKIDPQAGYNPGFDTRAKGHVVFKGVDFQYPNRKSKVLKGASFEAQPGMVVGMTGPAGCGKSTCMGLLQRFYDVTAGQIILDGKDIREYNPQWLRAQMVIVAQEPKMLPLSIRINLIFACKEEPTAEEIEQACRKANIWDTISDPKKFPQGLETEMSAIQNISGGEKQRLCIARAILANPPILLLDEATSALDEVNQEQVQEALNELMKGRTTFVIAHRLSTIQGCDKILGFRDGVVIDDGTHAELLAKPEGVYKQMWTAAGAAVAPTPTLQRTTSKMGKFDVLRSTILKFVQGNEEMARPVLDIIDEMKVYTQEMIDSTRAVHPVDHLEPGSQWRKVPAARHLGLILQSAQAGSQQEELPTKGPRGALLRTASA